MSESRTNAGASFTLFEQQRRLLAVIVGDAMESPEAGGLFVGGKLSIARRVGIYRHAYLVRLVDCLRDDFPALEQALGADDFDCVCRAYVTQHPPSRPTLNDYGRDFPTFLRDETAVGAGANAWAAELAALEWATVDAIHADATSVLELSELASVPVEQWGDLRLLLSPSAAWFAFEHSVNDYLTAAKEGDAEPRPPAARKSWVLVSRRDLDVWRLELAEWAFTLLSRLANGMALGEAFDITAGQSQPDPAQVMRCFRDWIEAGVFAGFSLTAFEPEPLGQAEETPNARQ